MHLGIVVAVYYKTSLVEETSLELNEVLNFEQYPAIGCFALVYDKPFVGTGISQDKKHLSWGHLSE